MNRRVWVSLIVLTAFACGSEGTSRLRDAAVANDGKGESSGDCLEQVSTLEADETSALGQQAQQLLVLATGERSAELTWRVDNTTTRVTLAISGAKAQRVESRVNPEARGEIARSCVDRVRIVARGVLQSADGRLDETLPEVAFDADEQGQLSAWFSRKRAELGGTYAQHALPAQGELTSLYFSITLAPGRFAGDVSEEVTTRDSVGLSAAIGMWSADQGASDAAIPTATDAATPDAGLSAPADASARDASTPDASALKGCYGDGECASLPGTKCSASTECLSPPGCGGQLVCPAVCYGYCR